MRIAFFTLVLAALAFHCQQHRSQTSPRSWQSDTLSILDSARQRLIPLAITFPAPPADSPGLVIFSHGYGQNDPRSYLAYGYLTQWLNSQGFVVVSVQHELPADPLLPVEGDLWTGRLPFWERGTDNLFAVIQWLKVTYPALPFDRLILMGHSNGGDMTALFPQRYPGLAARIVTLDNRRVPLPRQEGVLSLRSSDFPADEGVLPSPDEARKWNMSIQFMQQVGHNDMDESGTPEQHAALLDSLATWLAVTSGPAAGRGSR